MSASGRIRRAATAAAPVVFVLVWSTGFVGAKYGLPYAEPFTFLALRLGLAGMLLAALAVTTRSGRPAGRGQYGRAAVAGLLLHAGYLGGVFSAISLGLPASVAAVVVSLQPVLTAALATRLLGERLVALQWLGLAVGVVGVALVLAPGLASASGESGAFPPAGVASALVALLAGTAGTLWQKRHGDSIPLLSGTAVQYAAAALVLLAAAAATETMAVEWTAEFVAALAWLVVPLSLGAVLLLFVLLRRGSAAGVSSLFYLVPPATAVEAYLLFGEELPLLSLAGVVVTTVGVALVLRPPGRRARQRATMGA
ncbi:EamA-like transporter family protein [Modestobacter sp. DSM 44400]|uniref:DMT family transporter n=1 Tax=Modestobacter sp. DSM 44400 TaxID=1550230 RepID=UPI00089633A0|nr:DMT family transporter [Modestobacter sp. DSM 44400]SDY34928.1 EamA-like transporter family protein [Modestobacter sp. DSM 44400]